jgi:hypothetical protein
MRRMISTARTSSLAMSSRISPIRAMGGCSAVSSRRLACTLVMIAASG